MYFGFVETFSFRVHPLDVSEQAQFRANSYRSSSARVAAMAKALVMRLADTPSLPTVPLVHNLPGISGRYLQSLLRPLHSLPFPHLLESLYTSR